MLKPSLSLKLNCNYGQQDERHVTYVEKMRQQNTLICAAAGSEVRDYTEMWEAE